MAKNKGDYWYFLLGLILGPIGYAIMMFSFDLYYKIKFGFWPAECPVCHKVIPRRIEKCWHCKVGLGWK